MGMLSTHCGQLYAAEADSLLGHFELLSGQEVL